MHGFQEYLQHAYLWAIGSVIGLGQLLISDAPLTWRAAAGRAFVSGGLATIAGSVLLFVAGTPNLALFGVAAALASLGTSLIERVIMRYVRSKFPEPHDRRTGDAE
ncbi:MAG: phage holin family protein [Phycisphaerales bacterium]|nr:phage holin family protein [Phycisphaerales bacterium]MBY0263316.1 phage holin family protein [Phycisphaerales bacterium]